MLKNIEIFNENYQCMYYYTMVSLTGAAVQAKNFEVDSLSYFNKEI